LLYKIGNLIGKSQLSFGWAKHCKIYAVYHLSCSHVTAVELFIHRGSLQIHKI